jgi:hypothetical protein
MTTLKRLSPLDPLENKPQCVITAEGSHSSLAVDFQSLDGRVHGFPYAHLLNYICEKNPAYASHPQAPPDRFSFAFSTHDVLLLGWRLSGLLPSIRQGKLLSLIAVSDRFYGLSKNEPFICDISVSLAKKV